MCCSMGQDCLKWTLPCLTLWHTGAVQNAVKIGKAKKMQRDVLSHSWCIGRLLFWKVGFELRMLRLSCAGRLFCAKSWFCVCFRKADCVVFLSNLAVLYVRLCAHVCVPWCVLYSAAYILACFRNTTRPWHIEPFWGHFSLLCAAFDGSVSQT